MSVVCVSFVTWSYLIISCLLVTFCVVVHVVNSVCIILFTLFTVQVVMSFVYMRSLVFSLCQHIMYLSASCVGSLSRSFLSTFLSCLLWSLSELVMSPLVFCHFIRSFCSLLYIIFNMFHYIVPPNLWFFYIVCCYSVKSNVNSCCLMTSLVASSSCSDTS